MPSDLVSDAHLSSSVSADEGSDVGHDETGRSAYSLSETEINGPTDHAVAEDQSDAGMAEESEETLQARRDQSRQSPNSKEVKQSKNFHCSLCGKSFSRMAPLKIGRASCWERVSALV